MGKVKTCYRGLAAFLIVSLVLQMFLGGGIHTMTALADRGEGAFLSKTIQVYEHEIWEAWEDYDGTLELESRKLPLPEDQRKEAAAMIRASMKGAVLVRQEDLGDDCAAVVGAIIAEGEQGEPFIEEVYLSGINGGQRPCTFSLELISEGGLVVKRANLTVYAMEPLETATASDATASDGEMEDATASDATASDADSDEEDPYEDEEEDSDEEDRWSSASDSDADRATASDARSKKSVKKRRARRTAKEAKPTVSFEEEETRELSEEELEALVRYLPATASMTFMAADISEENLPEAEVQPGGIVLLEADNLENYARTEVYVSDAKDSVPIGQTMNFNVAMDLSGITGDSVGTLYSAVQFEISEDEDELWDRIRGPEQHGNDNTKIEGEKPENLQQLIDLLERESEGIDPRITYTPEGGWENAEWYSCDSGKYYYCPAGRVAVFAVDSQGATTEQVLPFTFANGAVKDGVSLTGHAVILNKEELIDAYVDANMSGDPGPGEEKDEAYWTERAEAAITEQDASIKAQSLFKWDPVSKTTDRTDLGNLYELAEAGGVIDYTIRAGQVISSEITSGMVYTKSVELEDRLYLRGLIIEGAYKTLKVQEASDGSAEIYMTNGTDQVLLMSLNIPASCVQNPRVENHAEYGERIVFTYQKDNDTVPNGNDGKSWFDGMNNMTLNEEDVITAKLNLGELLKKGALSLDPNANAVYIDNHADLTVTPVSGEPINTEADAISSTGVHHEIMKMAYEDPECTVPERYFHPEDTVYYKITAYNGEYRSDEFVIRDQLPAGLVWEEAELVSLTVDGQDVSSPLGTIDPVSGKIQTEAFFIPDNGQAELVIRVPVETDAYFKKEQLTNPDATRLVNRAGLYHGDGDTALADTEYEVNVVAESATEGSFELSKIVMHGKEEQGVRVGEDVSYKITATGNGNVPEGAGFDQAVTATDLWPGDKLLLKKISGISKGTVIVLKDQDGDEISRYLADGTKKEIQLADFIKSDGISLDEETAKTIRTIEITMMANADNGKTTSVQLTGTAYEFGMITNGLAEVPGEETKVMSTNMTLSKAAYRISSGTLTKYSHIMQASQQTTGAYEYKTGISDISSEIYSDGDVVCYEIAVRNPTNNAWSGENVLTLKGVELTDDFNQLFHNVNEESGTEGSYVPLEEIRFYSPVEGDGREFPVFLSNDGRNTPWYPIETFPSQSGTASYDKTSGELKIELPDISYGRGLKVRFYLYVPGNAVGEATAVHTNQVRADYKIDTTAQDTTTYTLTATRDITTQREKEQKASIQKEVVAVGKELELRPTGEGDPAYTPLYLKHAVWYDESIPDESYSGYTTKSPAVAGKGDYVFYKITIKNESDENVLNVREFSDQLPEGLEFVRLVPYWADEKNDSGVSSELKATGDYELQIFCDYDAPTMIVDRGDGFGDFEPHLQGKNTRQSLYLYESGKADPALLVNWYHTGTAIKMDKEKTEVRMRFHPGNGAIAGIPQISVDGQVEIGLIARVVGDLDHEIEVTNTAKLRVDKAAVADDESYEMPSQYFDGFKTEKLQDPNIGYDKFTKEEADERYRVISAEADIIGSKYSPGITKTLDQYKLYSEGTTGNSWVPYAGNPGGLEPSYDMLWKVELQNGTNGKQTSGPLPYYAVRDTLPEGMTFHYDVTYDGEDSSTQDEAHAAYLMLPTEDGGTEKFYLPYPIVLERYETGEPRRISWMIQRVSEESNEYRIVGQDRDGTENVPVTTSKNLSIPANGMLELYIPTKPQEGKIGSMNYGTYVNRAILLPDNVNTPFDEDDVSAGEIVSEYVPELKADMKGVAANAQIDILRGGTTSSEKEIRSTYDGSEQNAKGSDSQPYVISDAGGEVTYTLNVTNQVEGEQQAATMKALTLIDHLPAVGDSALVYQSPRGSVFPVTFTENPNVTVEIAEKEADTGNYKQIATLTQGTDYHLWYGQYKDLQNANGFLSDAAWNEITGLWSDELVKDQNGAILSDSLKIELTQKGLDLLTVGRTLRVSFDAKVPEYTGQLDDIAWNTFAYDYTAGTANTKFRVEPPRVGVKIPVNRMSVTKRTLPVPDPDTPEDELPEFTFQIYRKKLGVADNDPSNYDLVTDAQYRLISGSDQEVTVKELEDDGTFTLKHGQTAEFNAVNGRTYRIAEVTDSTYPLVEITDKDGASVGTSIGEDVHATPDIVIKPGDQDTEYRYVFRNKKAVTLPETGGAGRHGQLYLGGGLSALAYVLCRRRKKRSL